MKFSAIDFETTAYLDGGKNEPWQLGCAIVSEGEIIETKEWFFGTALTPQYESIYDLWSEFSPYISGIRLVAHNMSTERTILTRLAPLTPWGPWTDTLKFAKVKYPKLSSYRLSDLCETFGCVPEIAGRTWHDALFDAVACAKLAIKIKAL